VTDRLPIFPLATVLYPGLILPLHVFEPRYRQLVRDLQALPAERRQFGVVALRHGREVGDESAIPALHDVGCVARLREIEALADGRFALVTTGGPRFRVGALDHTRAYLQAEVALLDEPPGEAAGELARVAAKLFTAYRLGLTGTAGELEIVDDAELVSYVVAAAMMLDLKDKQAFLEAATTADRLRMEVALLRREIGVLNVLPSLPAVDLLSSEVSQN
jgi:hypothetical protein